MNLEIVQVKWTLRVTQSSTFLDLIFQMKVALRFEKSFGKSWQVNHYISHYPIIPASEK